MKRISCIALTLFLVAAAYAAAAAEGEAGAAGDGPLVLSMFITLGERQQSMAPGENRYTDYLQEKFNVSFDLTVVPGEARLEKQNLLLASGTYPDIFFDGQFSPADQMKYGGQGVLIPLNDLIANHGPAIQEAWEILPVLQKWMVTPDGNIYSIPAVEECYHCSVNQKHWINTTWLEQLGLDMPGTTDEYEAVLTAFRDDDPNGNGEQDEIPLTGAVNTWSADVQDFLMSAFIYTDGQRFLTADNGTIIFTPDKPEWRDGLRWINRLYTSGLIDSEAFTNSRDTLRALANRPDDLIVGAYAAGHALMGAQEEGIWQQYRVVPPLRGPGGVQLTAYRPYMPNFGRFAITNKASDAVQQRAMELANWFYTTEGTLEMGVRVARAGVGRLLLGLGRPGRPRPRRRARPLHQVAAAADERGDQLQVAHRVPVLAQGPVQQLGGQPGHHDAPGLRALPGGGVGQVHRPRARRGGAGVDVLRAGGRAAHRAVAGGDPELRGAEHGGVHHRPARHRDRVGLLRAGLRRPAPGPLPGGDAKDLRRLPVVVFRRVRPEAQRRFRPTPALR